jgi:hypothetical protein
MQKKDTFAYVRTNAIWWSEILWVKTEKGEIIIYRTWNKWQMRHNAVLGHIHEWNVKAKANSARLTVKMNEPWKQSKLRKHISHWRGKHGQKHLSSVDCPFRSENSRRVQQHLHGHFSYRVVEHWNLITTWKCIPTCPTNPCLKSHHRSRPSDRRAR